MEKKKKSFANINFKSFITVVIILSLVIAVSGALSYIIPTGSFERDEDGSIIPGTYAKGEVEGIAIWRVITAPARVFFSEDALTIIMICLFLVIMSGVFNLIEKTDGIRILIGKLVKRIAKKDSILICISVFIFMLFGSFFGMYEELITLLPLMILLSLSLGMDTMMGLGLCLLAACFGFSAAITNPFSVGLAASIAGVDVMEGVWLRIVFFALIYTTLVGFLILHLKKIRKNPKLSPTYEIDIEKRDNVGDFFSHTSENENKTFNVYAVFFSVQIILLILIASVRAISGYAIPLLGASFLIGGFICGILITKSFKETSAHFLSGAVSMLPAVVMIAIASSVKLIMSESEIIDTVMNFAIEALENTNKFTAVLFIYFLVLFLQIFIGSASAKLMLIMPILMPVCSVLGISPATVILVYCIADGFSDVFIPTNPILLIGLSITNVSYAKWIKWTWKLQIAIFSLTILVLLFAVSIGY